jgi:hypothetical protein
LELSGNYRSVFKVAIDQYISTGLKHIRLKVPIFDRYRQPARWWRRCRIDYLKPENKAGLSLILDRVSNLATYPNPQQVTRMRASN